MSGKVTFLFTDLEDSTRQWERHADAMRDALLRHDAILQAAIDEHGGVLVKHTGDGVCAAFADAARAAQACIAAQRALQRERFDQVALRSRMAIYTGVAERQGSDYRGAVLNRAARLMAAAHGGQVLVSQSARAEIGDGLPPGLHLRDMGLRRLKDVAESEQVFQLVADGLASEFPPLRTQDARRLDVPAPTTKFVGRERDLDAIAEAFRGNAARLLTLTGAGGTGKSRLAIEVARRLADDYADGVIFVPLAAVAKAEMALPAIAQALDVRETVGEDLSRALCNAIRDRNLLLVLDNFEQIVEAAPVVNTLLEAAPRLHVLVTSREPVRISGEREHAVAPLVIPDMKRLPESDVLARVEAVELFVARAQAVKPDLRLDAANARDIADICCRVDGLPLAIELAAARVRVLPVARIRTELDERLRFLVGGARNQPERHRTLRTTIDWSYRLLDAREQALFRKLAIFVDGATLGAVEAVCGDDEIADLVADFDALVAKSLLREVGSGAEPRFAMLETIREFALERLNDSGDAPRVADVHAEYFARLAEESYRHRDDPSEAECVRRLERDHENLRAALAHSVSTPVAARGLRMCKALFGFWTRRGHLVEGRQWCARMLEASTGAAGDFDRIATAHALAVLATRQGDHETARPLFEQCAAQLRECGRVLQAANVLNNLGNLLLHVIDLPGARRAYEESLSLKRQIGAPVGITLSNLASVLRNEGDLAGARALLEEAVERERTRGDLHGLAVTRSNLSTTALVMGDVDTARLASEEALAIVRQLDAKGLLPEVLMERGSVAMADGDLLLTRACYVEALAVAAEMAERRLIAAALDCIGKLAMKVGTPLVAARNFAAAAKVRDDIKIPTSGDDASSRADARAMCGNDAAFEAAWREGSSAPLESAVDLALHAFPP